MVTINSALVVMASLAVSLRTVNALGCYQSNAQWSMSFDKLYGYADSAAVDADVRADISRICNKVDGSTVAPGKSWSDCTNFDRLGPGNHINYQIAHDGNGGDTRTMEYDICKSAFEWEYGGCSDGSEQNHLGFWFRIDPNQGRC